MGKCHPSHPRTMTRRAMMISKQNHPHSPTQSYDKPSSFDRSPRRQPQSTPPNKRNRRLISYQTTGHEKMMRNLSPRFEWRTQPSPVQPHGSRRPEVRACLSPTPTLLNPGEGNPHRPPGHVHERPAHLSGACGVWEQNKQKVHTHPHTPGFTKTRPAV